MLVFAGLGISGADSITLELKRELEKADLVYLEQFTSPILEKETNRIKSLTKGNFKLAKRWLVEDGNEILQNAKKENVVLLSYGDPFIATTHIELRTRAIRESIQTRSIHSSSSLTSMIGECGLHYYKIGRVVTLMSESKSFSYPYYIIYKNIVEGVHTVLLLEYNQDKTYFLDPKEALDRLVSEEGEQKRNTITDSTFVIIASRIGFEHQSIVAGTVSNLRKKDFGQPPHSIIIPGNLHFTEIDALKAISDCSDEPTDNSQNTKKISKQMMEKYVPMIKEALKEVKPHYKNSREHQLILENAEHYIDDAQKFLEDGKDEVAILSIGYADGLVDSLRMAKGLDPKM